MTPESYADEPRETPPATGPEGLTSLVDRPRRVLTWAGQHRLVAGLVAAGCLLALAAAFWLVVADRGQFSEATLEKAFEALDNRDYGEARQMAETLRQAKLSPDDPLGAAPFLLGAAAAYEADDAWNVDQGHLYLVASRYLEEARDLGFPPDREGEGLYLLGRSLYLTGQMAASRLVLREALDSNPWMATEIHRLLAAAFLEDANPKLLEALEQNTIHLADPTLADEARHRGLLQRGEILLRLGKTAECLKTLDQIPSKTNSHVEAVVLRGRVLMHEARARKDTPRATDEDRLQATRKLHAAIETLRLAQDRDTLAAQASRRATYLIGVCFLELGDDRGALSQFGRTCRKYIKTPEAQAAHFQIAEIDRRLGRDEQAVEAYHRALSAVTGVKQYSNPWLTLGDLRAGMLRAYEHYRDGGDFPTCLQLTRFLYPLFSQARTIELRGETYQLWGRSLLGRADHLPLSKAEPLEHQGRAQWRRGGRPFERLPALRRVTSHYPDDLWDAAECYLEGRGYHKAVEMLQAYLTTQSRRGHPRALVSLGEALLAVGRIDEALAAWEECIAFHSRDAASFRARLAASRAYQEKGELDKALALLEENLSGETLHPDVFLTPDSPEWRDSLFALGHMLHVAGRDEEAIPPLEEAVARYPQAPRTVQARYSIADAYRRRAKQAQHKLQEDLPQTARGDLTRQVSQFLGAALDQYQRARDALIGREKTSELTRLEQSLLRNCYYAVGSVLFELGRYDEAVSACLLATNRYQNAPEVLEAYVQIARAYHRLNKPDAAQKTVEQAKATLDRVKSLGDFAQTTIYTADEWSGVFDSLSSKQ